VVKTQLRQDIFVLPQLPFFARRAKSLNKKRTVSHGLTIALSRSCKRRQVR
jgi:hypothetical protein